MREKILEANGQGQVVVNLNLPKLDEDLTEVFMRAPVHLQTCLSIQILRELRSLINRGKTQASSTGTDGVRSDGTGSDNPAV
jgi:hypothetical protein